MIDLTPNAPEVFRQFLRELNAHEMLAAIHELEHGERENLLREFNRFTSAIALTAGSMTTTAEVQRFRDAVIKAQAESNEAYTRWQAGFSVGVYLVDQCYGGPEEGGWYFDGGELVNDPQFPAADFDTEDEADAYAEKLRVSLRELNEGRRPKHSVLSEGVYEVHVFEGPLPESFPEVRPHYE